MTDLIICNNCNKLVEDRPVTRQLHTQMHFIDSWANYPDLEKQLFGESTDWGPDPGMWPIYTSFTSGD
jgi:hypothetical protein